MWVKSHKNTSSDIFKDMGSRIGDVRESQLPTENENVKTRTYSVNSVCEWELSVKTSSNGLRTYSECRIAESRWPIHLEIQIGFEIEEQIGFKLGSWMRT